MGWQFSDFQMDFWGCLSFGALQEVGVFAVLEKDAPFLSALLSSLLTTCAALGR